MEDTTDREILAEAPYGGLRDPGAWEASQLICSPIREENMGLSDGVYCLPGTSQGPPWGLVSRVWFFFELS